MSGGSEFQSRGAEQQNARSDKYEGVRLWMALKVGMHQNCSAENSKINSFGVRPNKRKDRINCTEQ